ncbi:DNA-directed RNA polymerase subunit alpha C-terminal domain-containing protein [Butyrivibrio sp. LC3010]|uniref:DNA-directed RNA polymerase subunit alpha C-terminal domain-containing protein n=1 Tax=Butyrivibrio sp. LC3010 TaxID=1280680 RepID=UPI0018C9392E|nr:DNA-directed RNA polymerase subunit alpha C-terminal domain-containing protein [Butyrivibrio sp. LC3010]
MISIDTIGLSVRSINALHRADIHTVGDMLECNEDSLNEIRNLGKKSIDEILQKIEEYQEKANASDINADNMDDNEEVIIPEDFNAWLLKDDNRQLIIDWLKEKDIKTEMLELLSARAFNLLMFNGYNYVYQIAFMPGDKLIEIPRMDMASATEIERVTTSFIRALESKFFQELSEKKKAAAVKKKSIFEILYIPEYHDAILAYVKANNISIEKMVLSNRPKNRLISNGYNELSDVLFLTRSEMMRIPAMGAGSVDEIVSVINNYLTENEKRMMAVISGDESAIWDDTAIRNMVLNQYKDIPFKGLSLNEMLERLCLPEHITVERLKKIIGQLIAEKKLEYVDYRCYRVYSKFEDYLETCSDIGDRERDFINKRLNGLTLEAIAQEYGLTRERVRQLVKRSIENVRNIYSSEIGISLFDEDYYRYLYETYSFEKKDGTEWLGIPTYVWNYLALNDIKPGKKDLLYALEDVKGLDAGLRLKIKNYLNRNKLFIDGKWIEKKRADLEQVVVRKFCKEDVTFNEFYHIYNEFLEQEDIPYDEGIYYTEAVLRSRKNHLADSRFLLWKQNEQIRYYDIDGRDYSELFDVLNLDSYENIELSTLKFVRDYPDIMKKYDIRDQYELHNLLRKIVPDGSFHDFHCCRMPDIRFGTFDRDSAILEILIDSAPINMKDLAELVSEEYGYDPTVVMANYLQSLTPYYHQGIYSIDQKMMSQENRDSLKIILTDDFYYIDEIKKIYGKMAPDADADEINPYNLKLMGFAVFSRYAIQNHSSAEAFFYNLLTKEDMMDISEYRKRFAYLQVFYQTLLGLKRDLEVVEFEPNQIINLNFAHKKVL